ncbi:MAG: hypothetical protein NT159_13710 [Proteobacteria bacterium]|nr:hypothetical protein [Pseudomonadota bacterium]
MPHIAAALKRQCRDDLSLIKNLLEHEWQFIMPDRPISLVLQFKLNHGAMAVVTAPLQNMGIRIS